MADSAQEMQSTAERLRDLADQLSTTANALAAQAGDLPARAGDAARQASESGGHNFMFGLTVFILAIFVGYHVVWRVTPALHSPLMAVTNAVSSVIIVGALLAAGPAGFDLSKGFGLAAVVLASVNIFGGFIVTQRMLSMFKKK
ncbi:NAD(P) transhydrogenase subunit alpha [Rhodovibrio sodomensis]|nr:NAD(P) transhydrogenase subunit alpha [Rhodovibrio sodomensis]